jgi:hypothetical protein
LPSRIFTVIQLIRILLPSRAEQSTLTLTVGKSPFLTLILLNADHLIHAVQGLVHIAAERTLRPVTQHFRESRSSRPLICSHLNSIDTAVSCRSNDDAGEVKLRKFSKQRLSELPLDSPKCVVT